MQYRLVIMHSEEEYAYALMDYMNQQKTFPFQVIAFTEKTLFFEYLKTHKVQILLLEEDFQEEGIKQIPDVSCYILTDEPQTSQLYGKQCIFRYQPVKNIMEKLVQYYTLEGNILHNPMAVSKHKMIAVCSSIYIPKQTVYSRQLAEGLSHTGKVLYVNFHPFVTTELFTQSQEFLISEAIEVFQMEGDKASGKIMGSIRHSNQLDYLVGVEQFQDLCELKDEEMIAFLQKIIKTSNYDVVILDLPVPCYAITAILTFCDEIYEVVDTSMHTESMRREFHRQLQLIRGETEGKGCYQTIDITVF